ncbi:PASTA domain-containing protein, partial [bacterium]|nr:PASTA domain-containing protein [bacterium]
MSVNAPSSPGADYHEASELVSIYGDLYDDDPESYPGAGEICGDGKDNDCDGVVDEGCGDPVSGVILGALLETDEMSFDCAGSEYDSTNTDNPHWKISSINGYLEFTFADQREFFFHAVGASFLGESPCSVKIYVNGELRWSDLTITNEWIWYTISSAQFAEGTNIVRIALAGQTNFWIDEVRINSNLAVWYRDGDGDGYGDPAATMLSPDQPAGYVANNSDCNDGNAGISPGASDIAGNGIDDDCDGLADNTGLPTVPAITGMSCYDAVDLLADAGLTSGTLYYEYSSTVPAYEILSQEPVAGSTAVIGEAVDIVISLGDAGPLGMVTHIGNTMNTVS